jgi:1-acyl-sn-glycerol-3-phosphate acyltransferase
VLLSGPAAGTVPTAPPASLAWTDTRSRPAGARKRCPQDAPYLVGRAIVGAIVRLTLDLDIQWQAPLPEGPKILAANHPTTTDPFYVLTLLSEPMSVLVTAGAFDVPGFGPYLRAAGHVPAIRGSGGATVDAVSRQVEAGRSVAVFPEGALSPLSGSPHRPHTGVVRVALRTGAPVIPLGIGVDWDRVRQIEIGMEGERTSGRLYTSGPYAITVGRPLYFGGTDRDPKYVRAVASEVMGHIRSLAGESQSRVARAKRARALPTLAWLVSATRGAR